MPAGEEVLIATVDGTQNSITVPAPSGGFQVGQGYQVNFVKDSQDLNTILAQSNQFSITQPNTTSSTTTSPSNTIVYVWFFFRPLAPINFPIGTAHKEPSSPLRRPRPRTVPAI